MLVKNWKNCWNLKWDFLLKKNCFLIFSNNKIWTFRKLFLKFIETNLKGIVIFVIGLAVHSIKKLIRFNRLMKTSKSFFFNCDSSKAFRREKLFSTKLFFKSFIIADIEVIRNLENWYMFWNFGNSRKIQSLVISFSFSNNC